MCSGLRSGLNRYFALALGSSPGGGSKAKMELDKNIGKGAEANAIPQNCNAQSPCPLFFMSVFRVAPRRHDAPCPCSFNRRASGPRGYCFRVCWSSAHDVSFKQSWDEFVWATDGRSHTGKWSMSSLPCPWSHAFYTMQPSLRPIVSSDTQFHDQMWPNLGPYHIICSGLKPYRVLVARKLAHYKLR